MIAHLAFAEGSPCPTLVLDARELPDDDAGLLAELTALRDRLAGTGRAHVLKIALVRPSANPMFDLDYRFVQALPGGHDRFELRGSCGHSVLAAALAAARCGMLDPLTSRTRVRVDVRNNGDHLVCEVEALRRDDATFRMHFLHLTPTPLPELLLTGAPTTTLDVADGEPVPVSLVSTGNPYVFVDAGALGIADTDALFADDAGLHDRLATIRCAAARRLGWPPEGAFPKVAAVLGTGPGRLAARALSVPSWHPTIALTGRACLGVAARIEGTVPERALRRAGGGGPDLVLETAGDTSTVTTTLTLDGDALQWSTVGGRRVTFLDSFELTGVREEATWESASA